MHTSDQLGVFDERLKKKRKTEKCDGTVISMAEGFAGNAAVRRNEINAINTDRQTREEKRQRMKREVLCKTLSLDCTFKTLEIVMAAVLIP